MTAFDPKRTFAVAQRCQALPCDCLASSALSAADMWGEALGYAGKKDEAQKQFAVAAGLDLSSADKAELAKIRG